MKKLFYAYLMISFVMLLSCNGDQKNYAAGLYNSNNMKNLCQDYALRFKTKYKPEDKNYQDADMMYTRAYSAMNGYLETYKIDFNPDITVNGLQDATNKCQDFIIYSERKLFPSSVSDLLKEAKENMKQIDAKDKNTEKYMLKYKTKLNIRIKATGGMGEVLSGVIEGLFKGGIAVAEYFDRKKQAELETMRTQINRCRWSSFADIK